MPHCYEVLNRIYRRLDIQFDHTLGESFAIPCCPASLADLRWPKASQSRASVGTVVPMGEGEPPAIIQKRDGAFTYTTSDLATIKYRKESWNPDAILYVVDKRQEFHFKSLFRH